MLPDIESEYIEMPKFILYIFSAAGCLAINAESQTLSGGSVKNVEIHDACFVKTAICAMRLATIHKGSDETFIYVDPRPIFVFKGNTDWYPCARNALEGICLRFSEEDSIQWNLLHGRDKLEKTALVVNGKVLSLLIGHRGLTKSPFFIGQSDGNPPVELKDFLGKE